MIMHTIFFSWLAKNPSKLTEEVFNMWTSTVWKESFDIIGKSDIITTLDDNKEKTNGNV